MNDNPHYQTPVPTAFDEYILVLLEPGPNRAPVETEAEKAAAQAAQMQHLALLKDLYDRGYSIGAGPFKEGGGGVLLLRGVDPDGNPLTVDDVRTLTADDPHIKSGHIVLVIRPFVMPKGIL